MHCRQKRETPRAADRASVEQDIVQDMQMIVEPVLRTLARSAADQQPDLGIREGFLSAFRTAATAPRRQDAPSCRPGSV